MVEKAVALAGELVAFVGAVEGVSSIVAMVVHRTINSLGRGALLTASRSSTNALEAFLVGGTECLLTKLSASFRVAKVFQAWAFGSETRVSTSHGPAGL